MKNNESRRGRRGGWQVADLPDASDASEWFHGRLPEAWFSAVDVTVAYTLVATGVPGRVDATLRS